MNSSAEAARPDRRRMRTFAAVAAVLAVSMTNLPQLAVRVPALAPNLGREAFWWSLTVLVLLYVLYVEQRPLTSLGFKRPTWKSVAIAVGAAVIGVATIAVIYVWLLPLLGWTMPSRAEEIRAGPTWVIPMTVIRSGVGEEVIFRGFAIERLESATGNTLLAAAISIVAFTLAHVPGWGWSPAQLLNAAIGGAIMSSLYLWRRDLTLNIMAHVLVDAVGFLAPAPT